MRLIKLTFNIRVGVHCGESNQGGDFILGAEMMARKTSKRKLLLSVRESISAPS